MEVLETVGDELLGLYVLFLGGCLARIVVAVVLLIRTGDSECFVGGMVLQHVGFVM